MPTESWAQLYLGHSELKVNLTQELSILRDEPRIPVVGGNAVLVNSWVRFTLSADCPTYSRAHDSVGGIVKFLGYMRRHHENCVIFGRTCGYTAVLPLEHISSLRFVR